VGDLVTWKFDVNRIGIVISSTLVLPEDTPYSPDPYRYPSIIRDQDLVLYRAVTVQWREGYRGTYFLPLPLSPRGVLQPLEIDNG